LPKALKHIAWQPGPFLTSQKMCSYFEYKESKSGRFGRKQRERNRKMPHTRKHGIRTLAGILSVLFLAFMGAGLALADGKKDMGGWELNSPYNKHYNASEMDRLKGRVKKVTTVVPMKGMAPGVALVFEESKEDTSRVHICPQWYLGPKDIGIKKGDKLKIRGAWAEIDDEFIFMASKIKKGDYFELKVRLTKNGKPFWTMSPEELAKETK